MSAHHKLMAVFFRTKTKSCRHLPTTVYSEMLNGLQSYPSKHYSAQLLVSRHNPLDTEILDYHNHNSSHSVSVYYLQGTIQLMLLILQT